MIIFLLSFLNFQDADYALKIMSMIKLYSKPIRVNKASRPDQSADVGANLFIGNLDPDVTETQLWEAFSRFGVIVTFPKIMRYAFSSGCKNVHSFQDNF